MNKYIYLILILSFISLNDNFTWASIIEGYVYGFDNTPIKVSHIKIKPLNISDDNQKSSMLIQTDSNGFYHIEIKDSVMYEIQVSGIYHPSTTFYFESNYFKLSKGDSLFNINVKLGSNIFDKQKNISIIYDFVNYKYYPMEFMSDNKFHYILKEPIDILKYQLTNIMNNNHTTNGTMADTFLLDAYGDYYSVIYTKHQIPYDIIFEPKLLPNVNSQPLFQSNDKNIESYLKTQLQIQGIFESLTNYNPLNSINSKKKDKEISSRQFIDSLIKILDYLKNEYLNSDVTYKKKLFGAYYLYFNSYLFLYNNIKILGIKLYPVEIDSKFVQKILQILLPTDEEWKIANIQNGVLTSSCFIAFKNLKNEYINNFLFNTPDDDFKRKELLQIISFITEYDNDASLLKYFKQIYISKYPNDYYTKEYLKTLNGNGVINVGKKLPIMKYKTLNKDTLNLENFKGYYILIDVWATWCGPCVKELPYINKAYLKYANEKLKIISISFDNDLNKVQNFQKEKIKMPWINCIEIEGFNSSFAKAFEINSIPKLILIDPERNIVASDDELRYDELFKILDEIFKNK